VQNVNHNNGLSREEEWFTPWPFVLVLIWICCLYFRPHPGTKYRPIFNWAHWFVGNSAYILGKWHYTFFYIYYESSSWMVLTIDISLPLRSVYLCRHVLSTVSPFILWWWKFEIQFDPPSRSSFFIGGQRWQPIQMGHSLHIRGRGEGGLDNLLMSMVLTLKHEFIKIDKYCTVHIKICTLFRYKTSYGSRLQKLFNGRQRGKVCRKW
jgi:hypothetical protein